MIHNLINPTCSRTLTEQFCRRCNLCRESAFNIHIVIHRKYPIKEFWIFHTTHSIHGIIFSIHSFSKDEYFMKHIFFVSYPFEIPNAIIAGVSIFVINFCFILWVR